MYKCFVGMQGRSGGVSSAWWHVRTTLRFALGKDLCMVPCHSCHIYLWDLEKGVGACLKFTNWGCRCKSQNGALFKGKAGSHYVILLYCEALLQVLLGIYCKRFYWIHLFTILLFFTCLRLAKPKVQLKGS